MKEEKKLHVKVKSLQLEFGSFEGKLAGKEAKAKTVMVEVKWRGRPKSGLTVPLSRSLSSAKQQRNCTSRMTVPFRPVLLNDSSKYVIEWNDGDDEFEKVCCFSVIAKDGSLGPWHLSLNILYGDSDAESNTRLGLIGKASVNLAELASKMEYRVERKLPIALKMNGIAIEASLLVVVTFADVRNANDSSGIAPNSAEPDGFFKRVKSFAGRKKTNKEKEEQPSSGDSDESSLFDSSSAPEDESSSSTTTNGDNSSEELSSVTECGSSSSSPGPQLDPAHKAGFFSWKRRRLSFRRGKAKGVESFIKNTDGIGNNNDGPEIDVDQQVRTDSPVQSVQKAEGSEISTYYESDEWMMREVSSRDGEAKLKTNVFFASFDQRSEKAAGESACTALVAVIAHWLHSNQHLMPTRPQFNTLITEGSFQWRKLCDNEAYTDFFPNKHFDLETVLEAGLKPLTVCGKKSFIGFFSPEKFECLKEAMSFDAIWDEIINGCCINSNSGDHSDKCESRVYIVSWNDHFFVLKVQKDACFIIDSLGERLFEGCNQAYILKFDESSVMYGKVVEGKSTSEESTNKNVVREEIICRGKECCREYIKRFLAAIPVAQLEMEEKKGTLSNFYLHHRLQIDFHYTFSLNPPTCT